MTKKQSVKERLAEYIEPHLKPMVTVVATVAYQPGRGAMAQISAAALLIKTAIECDEKSVELTEEQQTRVTRAVDMLELEREYQERRERGEYGVS
jgi:hypothetical protein